VISILGASGSGKSTLLRCINLLEIPDRGDIVVDGETIGIKDEPTAGARPVDRTQVDRSGRSSGMVFQSFNLWSHMTVIENVIERRSMCSAARALKRCAMPRRCSRRSASPTSARLSRPSLGRTAAARGDRHARSRCTRA
jgi:ABC-type histidine transport system ATPase subunit